MKPLLLALALATAAQATEVDYDRRSTFTQVKHMTLVDRADGTPEKVGLFAKWSGRLQLDGTLVVEFYRAEGTEASPNFGSGVVFFEPNASSLRRLPRAVGKFYPLAPTNIWVENADPVPVLAQLLGSSKATELALSKQSRFEIQVTIQLSEFGTSIDCDQRNYGMKYVNVRTLAMPRVIASTEARNIGC